MCSPRRGVDSASPRCRTAGVSLTEATIAWGFNPITSLSGTTVSAWRGLALVLASLGVYALPLLAITAIGVLLSTVTRNSAGAVVGDEGRAVEAQRGRVGVDVARR